MFSERRGAHGFVRAAAAALTLVLALGACEGENLFRNTEPVTEGPPSITRLIAPATARVGEFVKIEIHAIARRGLTQILVEYSGALNTDNVIGFAPGVTTVVQADSVELLQPQDSLLVIRVTARDLAGRTSAPVVDTVRVLPAAFGSLFSNRD